MKILVTGGAGFIGSHMARMLVERKFDVVIIDTLELGHKEALPGNAIFYEGNVGDSEKLSKIFEQHHIDAVVHFAGYTSVEESVKNPGRYFQNNTVGPLVLLEQMKKTGVKKIIFSSTAAVYGEPDNTPLQETHSKKPLSPYGLSKWCFEEALDYYSRSADVRGISLRYFNAAGAALDGTHGEDHIRETHLIPLALYTALGKRDQFLIFGDDYQTIDGTAIRDYIHVEDLCEAHICALTALENGHKTDVFNVGTGKGLSVKEVVTQIKQLTDKDFPVETVARRAGDVAELVADSSKIKKKLGWEPKYSDMKTIIHSAWKWHSSHPDGYKT